jgi:hypothetical protein
MGLGIGPNMGLTPVLDRSFNGLYLGVHRLVALEGFVERSGDPHDVAAVAHGGPEEVDPAAVVRLELPGLDGAGAGRPEHRVEEGHHAVEGLNEVAVAEDDGPLSRPVDEAEVRVALLDGDRNAVGAASLGEDLDESIAHGNSLVRRQQVGGVTIAGLGGRREIVFEHAEVAVVAATRPEVMVVVSRDEADVRRDRGVARPGPQCADELGEGGRSVLGSGEGQLEEVPQDDELGWILARAAEGPEALAQRRQERRGCGRIDALAVRGDIGQQAVERTQMEVGDAHPANGGHGDPFRRERSVTTFPGGGPCGGP